MISTASNSAWIFTSMGLAALTAAAPWLQRKAEGTEQQDSKQRLPLQAPERRKLGTLITAQLGAEAPGGRPVDKER